MVILYKTILNISPKRLADVTFRLDSSVLDELQRESDQREVSLNVLVNQALKRYADWDRYESRIGMMPVPKVMLSSLIDKAITVAKNMESKILNLTETKL